MKLQVINVVEMKNGMIEAIYSYPITDKSKRDQVVRHAENKFLRTCQKHNIELLTALEKEAVLDNGYFEPVTGTEVHLIWAQ